MPFFRRRWGRRRFGRFGRRRRFYRRRFYRGRRRFGGRRRTPGLRLLPGRRARNRPELKRLVFALADTEIHDGSTAFIAESVFDGHFPVGTGEGQRVGKRIFVKSIQVRWRYLWGPVDDPFTPVTHANLLELGPRVIRHLIIHSRNQGMAPTSYPLTTTAPAFQLQFVNHDQTELARPGQRKVVVDRTVKTPSMHKSGMMAVSGDLNMGTGLIATDIIGERIVGRHYKRYIKYNRQVDFDDDGVCQMNDLSFYWIASASGTNPVTIGAHFLVRYYDS